MSIASGEVNRCGYNPIDGVFISILSKEGLETTYCHLSEWYVSKGDRVKRGEVIAKSGLTGRTNGGHHLRLVTKYKNVPVCVSSPVDLYFGRILRLVTNGKINKKKIKVI